MADNRGLARATDGGPTLGVFVFDPNVLAHGSPPRVAFMLEALAALRERYRERGGDLLVRRGDPRSVLPGLAEEFGADAVGWNRDYSRLAKRRDRQVRAALEEAGVDHATHDDALLYEPGSITTNDGDTYQVYTYFGRKWHDRTADDPLDPPTGENLLAADDPGRVPSLADLGFDEPEADVEPAGPESARERLEAFCAGPIYRYAEDRDYPARGGTSRLSAHLRWGTVGIRAVYAATERARERADGDDERESVQEFQSQLAWRAFYAHVLDAHPRVLTENFKSYEHPIDWNDDPEGLAAWRAGETGFPVVDAGMRQLRAEGHMHNRVRMIVASFLTKDLLIDWRAGYAHFRRHLVDHDPANDSGGWQWAASTGTDAQPFFRIFNPTSQGERYDPDGEYVREYVPELRDATAEEIHSWPDLAPENREQIAPDYPAPILDHGERREQALATFRAARGDEE